MKKKMIILSLVLLSLAANFAGCTPLDKRPNNGKPDNPSLPNDIKVITMPPEFEKQLFELTGTNRIFFIKVQDANGNPVILKSSKVTEKKTEFPISTRKIFGISNSATVRYEGSNCITDIDNGMGRTFCIGDGW